MPNPIASLSRRLKAGDHLMLAWSGFADPTIPEAMLRGGYDAALVDLQHGAWTYASALAAISAANGAGKPCLARVPVGDFALASRLLDAGAAGVVAPMINSGADAAAFAAFCKFPPLGQRSWGPMRAMLSLDLGGADYLAQANQTQLALAMIETRAALDALDAILDHPGVDGALVGPADLSIALTGGRLAPESAEIDAALDRVAAACRARGKTAAAFCLDGARAGALGRRGFQLTSASLDQSLLTKAAAAELAAAKTEARLVGNPLDDAAAGVVHCCVFNALKAFVAELSGDASARQFGPQDLRVAAAALLVHVVDVDGVRTEAEAERLLELLRNRYSLDDTSARALVAFALRRGAEAVDFDEFATTLTRELDEAGRRDIVAMMWELARADGHVSEVEESAIWRVARLLGVLDPKSFAQEAMRKADAT